MDAASTRTRTILIEGMTSNLCIRKVEEALRRVGGITVESVTLGAAVVVCMYPAALGGARGAINYAGFQAQRREYSAGE
jgi:copper chaperone CopZ